MPRNSHGGPRKGAGRPSTGRPRKVKTSISLDAALLAHADATGNRSAYIETLIRRDTMTTQIWAHIVSGERYVVVVQGDTVVQAVGPLHYSDLDGAVRDGFDSDPEVVDDINADRDAYRITTDQI